MDNSELVAVKSEPSSNESLCDDDEYSNYQDTPEFIFLDSKLELKSPITESNGVLDLSCKLKKESYNDNDYKPTKNNPESPDLHSELIIKPESTEENKKTGCVNNKDSQKNCMTSETKSLLAFLNKKHYKCKDCDFETTKLHEYSIHLLFHTPGNEPKHLTCLNCRFKTVYKNHLATHMIRHHRTLNEQDMYKCKLCEHEALYQSSLKHHMLSHKSVKKAGWYQCAKCPYQSGYLNNLRKHVLHQHPDPEELLECNHCECKAV